MADPKLNQALQAENERIESAESVLSALRNHGGQLVEKLGSKAPVLPGPDGELSESVPARTAQSMVDWYLAWVTQLRDQMVTAGRSYRQARTFRSTVGRELGSVARVARKAAQGIRDQFFSTYGEDYSLTLGISRLVPRRVKALLEYLRYLEERLADPVEPLPEVALGRVGIDIAAQRQAVASLIVELEAANRGFDDVRRKAHAALVAKDDSIAAYDGDFVWVSTAIEAMFRAAGMKRQAEVVRPSRRRRIVVVQGIEPRGEEPSGEEPTGQEPDVEEPSGEEPTGDEASSEPLDESSSDDASANVVEAA